MNTTGQSGMETLRESFAHRDSFGNVGILGKRLEYFLELAQRRDQVGPFGRRLEVLERLLDRRHVAPVLAVIVDELDLFGAHQTHAARDGRRCARVSRVCFSLSLSSNVCVCFKTL